MDDVKFHWWCYITLSTIHAWSQISSLIIARVMIFCDMWEKGMTHPKLPIGPNTSNVWWHVPNFKTVAGTFSKTWNKLDLRANRKSLHTKFGVPSSYHLWDPVVHTDGHTDWRIERQLVVHLYETNLFLDQR